MLYVIATCKPLFFNFFLSKHGLKIRLQQISSILPSQCVFNIYLELGRQRQLLTNFCKISSLVEVETFQYLNKYLFIEIKYNNILERDALVQGVAT